jgi:hypothetical protein
MDIIIERDLNGNTFEVIFKADVDGRTAFTIRVINDHTLDISGGFTTKDSEGVLYSERLQIKPVASNVVLIEKQRYE